MIKDTSDDGDDGDDDQTSDNNQINAPSDVQSDLTSAVSEEDNSSNGAGGLKCRASNGKLCKFPFEFRGKVFASCTTDFDPENRSWCSTKVDSQGVHISGQGEYGYCPASCRANILTTPPPPAQAWAAWSQC